MVEKQSNKLEREYIIPLREKCRSAKTYKKTPKAVKTIKEFLAKHMKVENRDLEKIKIDMYLNEQLWVRGIKKPLHKVKVKAVREGDIIRVYATDLPAKINFKKIRNEKKNKEAEEAFEKHKESQKSLMEKAKDQVKGKSNDKDNDGIEDKEEEKLKEETSKLAEEQIEKEMAKKEKHTTKANSQRSEKAKEKGYDKQSRGH